MKRTELLHRCEELIDSFDPSRTTVDAHATTTIGNGKSPDILFLKQVLSGCIRYQRMLKVCCFDRKNIIGDLWGVF